MNDIFISMNRSAFLSALLETVFVLCKNMSSTDLGRRCWFISDDTFSIDREWMWRVFFVSRSSKCQKEKWGKTFHFIKNKSCPSPWHRCRRIFVRRKSEANDWIMSISFSSLVANRNDSSKCAGCLPLSLSLTFAVTFSRRWMSACQERCCHSNV